MVLNIIKKKLSREMSMVDIIIKENLYSDVGFINLVGEYLISHGGKRLRPLLTVLFAKILECRNDNYILMAAVIELIHSATLLHDDVVDVSEQRRGQLTVNKKWGNREAILVGDFLYTRSFQMMLKVNNFDILKLIASTTNSMSEGEVMQLMHKGNINISRHQYFDIIQYKTAKLFSTAVSVVAILSNVNVDILKSVSEYGLHLGIAYQLVDDILDYNIFSKGLDKNFGDDIFNGVITLPLIHFLEKEENKKKFVKIFF